MITQEQIKDLNARVAVLDRCLDIEAKRKDVAERELQSQAPDFWDDPKEAEKFLKELAGVKFWVNGYDKVAGAVEDLNVLLEFEDEEIDQAYAAAVSELETLELRNMLGEEGDNLGAVLTINSGAGGTEANDWSAMLMRMYIRWAERNGYKVTVTDELEGEDAGIKSVTMQVEGDYAFGYLNLFRVIFIAQVLYRKGVAAGMCRERKTTLLVGCRAGHLFGACEKYHGGKFDGGVLLVHDTAVGRVLTCGPCRGECQKSESEC